MQIAHSPLAALRAHLRHLYYGRDRHGLAFQSAMLALDLAVLGYFLVTTFLPQAPWMDAVDLVLGLLLVAEFVGRMLAHRHPMAYLDNASALIDLVVIASLLLASLVDNLGFLRLLRTLRLLRSYQVLGRLRERFPNLRDREEVIGASLNLVVFLLMISSLVYVTQRNINPDIKNFVDALYFSVTSLTTTGYGDVLLVGTGGRLLSVAIMIAGISLFLRLAQAAFRGGSKVRFACPRCGLMRHDHDAVHCKACGEVLAIPNDEG
jgi:voltage-gated potassium channel